MSAHSYSTTRALSVHTDHKHSYEPLAFEENDHALELEERVITLKLLSHLAESTTIQLHENQFAVVVAYGAR